MKEEKTFYELWRERKVQAESIEDFVNDWQMQGMARDVPLHEYLGLSFEEYIYWVKNPHSIMKILMFKLNDKLGPINS